MNLVCAQLPSRCRIGLASAALLIASLAGPARSPAGQAPMIPTVEVPGGCFSMGDGFGAGAPDEKPVHEVCLDGFTLGKYPVTQGQWLSVMGKNPSQFRGDDLPVENVSWNEVQGFLERLNRETGKKWRLPTEAEWEYAARSGGKKEKYPGTSRDAELDRYAWLESNSDFTTHPVGLKRPNQLGLYDMAGNVWQWVWDRYDGDYYRQSPRHNPKGDPFGANRILKGGSALTRAHFLRVSNREYQDPDKKGACVGFRLVLDTPKQHP